MNNTNLELSKAEYALITNSDFILTKNNIIKKIFKLFGALSEDYKVILNDHVNHLPKDLFSSTPKIFKGEQYQDLPYVMLDYPRQFSKTNIFAIRSFFWWGNYFSITLHLSGDYYKIYADAIFQLIKNLKNKDWFICVNENEWEHHFEKDNYIIIDDLNELEASKIKQKQFIKIANKLSLSNWQNAEAFYKQCYKNLLALICQLNYLTGETVL